MEEERVVVSSVCVVVSAEVCSVVSAEVGSVEVSSSEDCDPCDCVEEVSSGSVSIVCVDSEDSDVFVSAVLVLPIDAKSKTPKY